MALVNKSTIWEIISQTEKSKHGFKGVKLEVGNLVKFGRNLFKVIEIDQKGIRHSATHLSGDFKPLEQLDEVGLDLDSDSIESSLSKSKSKKNNCRICLEGTISEEDPLVHLCKCTGSVKFIHYQCLLQWIESQRHVNEHKGFSLFKWKTLSCEICKSKFDDEKLQKAIGKSMFHYDTPENDPFIALEGIKEKEVERTYAKIVFLVKFYDDKKKVLVGRAPGSDVKIKDIQISRFHAYFHIVDSETVPEVWLEDLDSRFGTLVSKDTLKLVNKNSHVLSLQCGVFNISLSHKRAQNYCFCIPMKPKEVMAGFQFSTYKDYYSEKLTKALVNSLVRKSSKVFTTNLPLSDGNMVEADSSPDQMHWDNQKNETQNNDQDWNINMEERKSIQKGPIGEGFDKMIQKKDENLPSSSFAGKNNKISLKPDFSLEPLNEESKGEDIDVDKIYDDYRKYEIEKRDRSNETKKEYSNEQFLENNDISSLIKID